MQNEPKQTFSQKLFSGSGWALFTMFVWELVEEALETVIAYMLSSAVAIFITKALSTLAIITATQAIKVAIKRFMTPVIREFTYKEGTDKVSKIKQFFTWIWCNKKTLLGTASAAVMTLSGTGVIDVAALPAIMVGGLNITVIIYYACLAILALIGMFGKGFESIKTFFERMGLIKAEKAQKAIEKEAQKEIKAEAKAANQTQAELDKKAAKEAAQKEADAAKEKAEKEHRALVDAAKAKIIAEQKKANTTQA